MGIDFEMPHRFLELNVRSGSVSFGLLLLLLRRSSPKLTDPDLTR
jgi:hypothetical protein